jgi:hypothetical protein
MRPARCINVPALFPGSRHDQTAGTEPEIKRFVDIFELLQQIVFPHHTHIRCTVLNVRRDIGAAQEEKAHTPSGKRQNQFATLLFVDQRLAIKANSFQEG